MILAKKTIQTRFNNATHSYDEVAHIQKTSAQILIEQLRTLEPNFQPKTILDLGTGTGYVPEILLPLFPNAYYTLNDIAPNMIAFVQNKFKAHQNINFCIGDLEQSCFQEYDLIISNFALQWSHHLENTLNTFYDKAKILAFTCLLEDSFKEWDSIFKQTGLPSPVKQYPTESVLKAYLSFFKNTKHHFEIKTFILSFKNAKTFMQYLRNLGASASIAPLSKQDISYIINKYNIPIQITYKIFVATIRRL